MDSKLGFARYVKGYTQTDFAKAIGISRGYLNKIEGGIQIPSIKIISSISKVLEIPIVKVIKMFDY